ncbi:MAG TPA: NAD(P)-dependent oxidoreductase [Ignavibacteriaceae bacterium]|nr:NAD(P)-dependent oxidoreductase [Ignavibacteriaceae bacterium]
MNNTRIAVVTGATGFVGSHLVDQLLKRNYTIRCITRKTSSLKWLEGKNVEIFDTGLMDKEGLRKAFKDAEYIFHVAGVVKAKRKEGYFKGNVDTTKNLLEVAEEFKENIKRFVIVSSQTAAGPSFSEEAIDEKITPHPITTYGRSKLAEEEVGKSFMDSIPVTICRAPAVYGERDSEIFIFFKTFSQGLMTQIGFDKKKVSFIHAEDFVIGLIQAAESDKAANELYFISSEKYYSWEEIGTVTAKVLDKKPFKIRIPHFLVFMIMSITQFFALFSRKATILNIEKAKDITQPYWTCDTSKAIRDFGYHQNISIEEGIKRTCDWYKKMGWIK